MAIKKIIQKHPLAIRWLHWINFPILGIMIWSGMLIYWANDVYRLGWGDTTLLKFFPNTFYELLDIPFHLADGMSFHFAFMWLFVINGFIYIMYLAFSKEWKFIVPERNSFKEAWQVVLHDLHLRKAIPTQTKYNAAQRIAYTGVILMGIVSVTSGLAIYKPVQLNWLCARMGGYEFARILHFTITLLFCIFFVIHIVQVVIAGWNNFASMIRGFEIQKTTDKMNSQSCEIPDMFGSDIPNEKL